MQMRLARLRNLDLHAPPLYTKATDRRAQPPEAHAEHASQLVAARFLQQERRRRRGVVTNVRHVPP